MLYAAEPVDGELGSLLWFLFIVLGIIAFALIIVGRRR